MDKFDNLCNEYLEEGILGRAGERIKNVGRAIKHPFARAFGDGDDNVDAISTSNKGYRKQKMLKSRLMDALGDLVKLGVVQGDAQQLANDVTMFLGENGSLTFNDSDRSKMGQDIARVASDREKLDRERDEWDSDKEFDREKIRRRLDLEGDSAPESDGPDDIVDNTPTFQVKDPVRVTTRGGKVLGGTVKSVNPNGTYSVETTNGNRRSTMAYKPDQLEKI